MMAAWHFTAEPNKLRDGSPLVVGEWVEHSGPIELCRSGLHASLLAFDALHYAPGPYLWRVECDGEIEHSGESNLEAPKLVCSRRRAIAGGDATALLSAFSRRCALDVIHLWDPPPSGDPAAAAVALAAAWAARAAAWAASDAARAAKAAASDAARAAAWAASDAAWAASDAAWAARAAAWAAALAAAKAAQRHRLESLATEWIAGGCLDTPIPLEAP